MKVALRPVLSLILLALAPGFAVEPASAQESRSVFDTTTVLLPSNQPPFRRLADFNLDGDVDAVGVQLGKSKREYRVAYYNNDGSGVFSGGVQYSSASPGGYSPLLIEVGRLNDDPLPDLCILKGNERHDWLRGLTSLFVQQPPVVLPGIATALALADLDLDGLDDVLWMDASSLHLQTSTGSADSLALSGTKHSLRVLPRDGPFGSDLIVSHVNNDVRIVYGHASTGLVAGPIFAHGTAKAMVDTGDVDGDGDVDAVVFGMTSYRVLRRLTRADWALEPSVLGGPAEFLRDVDGDSDLDGVCCGGGGEGGGYEANVLPSNFLISINDGSGGFAPGFAIPGVGSPQLAGVTDVDLDGDADLVAGRCVYYADGPIRPLRASAVVPPQHGPRALSDCDGDGDVDVGFSVETVYSNDGTGQFTLGPSSALAPAGMTFRGPGYPGDYDGDGDVDLVAELLQGARSARANAPTSHGAARSMVLLRNDGQGALLDPLPAAPHGVTFALDDGSDGESSVPCDPERSLLADADQDGDLDLLTRTATYAPGETRLWANDGTGFFRPGGRRGYRALWAGDVDLDGDMDLIGCGAGYEGTSTYLLLGSNPRPGRLPTLTWDWHNGSWGQEIDAGIAVTDFDRNGYPDFACELARATDSSIRESLLLVNQFDTGGSLYQHSGLDKELDLAPEARVALGDVQGDSVIDALIGPLDLELVDISEVHLQRPGWPPLNFVRTLQLLSPGHLVDLDGDGDLDALGEQIVFNRQLP